MSELPEKEAEIFMNEYGIKESALNSIIREAYDLLGLQSFLTCGDTECRAWTIRKGSTAQEAAGEIHTDFYNNSFVLKLLAMMIYFCRNVRKGKEQGTWRLEGKNMLSRMEIF